MTFEPGQPVTVIYDGREVQGRVVTDVGDDWYRVQYVGGPYDGGAFLAAGEYIWTGEGARPREPTAAFQEALTTIRKGISA